MLAGVAGDGREPGEAGGAAVLKGVELGYLDQQGQRGGLAPGDAGEDVEAGLQLGVAHEEGAQGGVEGCDLALDLGQALDRLPLQEYRMAGMLAVQRGGPVLHQGAAADVEAPSSRPAGR